MKATVFRIPLLIAALSIAAASLQAAPSLPITEPPVTSSFLDGPPQDPGSTNGQWFLSQDGTEEYRTHEFHDNTFAFAGGSADYHAIKGVVNWIQLDANGDLSAFDVDATIFNDSSTPMGDESDASNSHEEYRQAGAERYFGTLTDTKLTAEFAIADLSFLPGIFSGPYRDRPPYIIADNEEQRGWYCWDEQDPPQGDEPGNYYVPTWDFGDIPLNQSANQLLKFSIVPPMDSTDPRYMVITNAMETGEDIFANRTTSLKISTWIDEVAVDNGQAYPDEVLRSSDVSVFHNEEPPYNPTHKMHYPQLPDPNGWDVRACYSDFEPDDMLQKVLADDFRCTSNGPITKITFWGSFRNDEYDVGEPFNGITNFHLSLHNDIAAGEMAEWSMPEIPAEWEWEINPFSPPDGWEIKVTPETPSEQGWYDPNTGQVLAQNHMDYFRYEITIPESNAFVQTEGNIYWLDISVQTYGPMWGWKTTTNHWNDDAVWADLPVLDLAQWKELYVPPEFEESLDLAFVIDGGETKQYDFGDLPDTYGTLLASGGAQHTIVPGIYLGTAVDAETDGQPNNAADGDDLNGATPDDEDGVLIGTIVAGQLAPIIITASIGGTVEAWMDVNNNGTFLDTGENLLTTTIAAGTIGYSLPIPASATPGPNAMRFRFNTLGALGTPTGPAINGEVEDYAVMVEELDWGDAPDAVVPTGYPTLNVNNGARHIMLGGSANALRLGALIDSEADGQPLNGADGDDILDGTDDEDGVTFISPLIPGTWANITVDVGIGGGYSGFAYLQGWIDFNADGDWTDTGEQIFTDQIVTFTGFGNLYSLSFPVPLAASNAITYARFRLSTTQGIGITGQAQDGEVEDYEVKITKPSALDWGDAFDTFQTPTYPTLYVNNGAHHLVNPAMYLGNGIDPELDGQPALFADGDDNNMVYPGIADDEDGVQFTTPMQRGGSAGVDVFATLPGMLDAWIDFNNDGDWADSGERIFNSQSLTAGINSLIFGVPTTASTSGPLVSRFRYSSTGVASHIGLALDGEVEDHLTDLVLPVDQGIDFGDAMDLPYPTMAPLGAQHTIVPGIMLGALIDAEPNGQPDPTATGDDAINLPDEDGVTFVSKVVAGSNIYLNVVAGTAGGLLDAWIDFDADGAWIGPEHLFGGTPYPLTAGMNANIATIPVPKPSALGPTFARFRISSIGVAGPTGAAPDGEVEDYLVELYQPQMSTNLVITNFYFTASNTVANVEWNAEAFITYQLQLSTNLVISNWVDVGTTVHGPLNLQTNGVIYTNQFYRMTAPWTAP